MSTTDTTTSSNQDNTSGLNGALSGLGDGIHVSSGAIAAIVILLVLALIGLIIACAYAFGGFKRCCSCCGRNNSRKKRLSRLPVYSDRGYLDERDKLPAWNASLARGTEVQGLSRMASVKQGIFGRKRASDGHSMLLDNNSPYNSARNSQLTTHSQLASPGMATPYMMESSEQKSRFSIWKEQQR